MQKETILIALSAVAAVGLCYAYRPERLLANQSMIQAFPAAGALTAAPALGRFHPVADESCGLAHQ